MKNLFERIHNYVKDIRSGEKKISRDAMLLLFFSGLLIYVILLPTNNNSSYENKPQESTVGKQQATSSYQKEGDEENYKALLEKELSEFLSKVEGVGETEVLIYLNSSKEYIVEKDMTEQNTTNSESGKESRSERRREEGTVYTENEAGRQTPFITKTNHPAVEGIVIAAEGAENEAIRIKLIRTVMALYGVDANKIDVVVRKSANRSEGGIR